MELLGADDIQKKYKKIGQAIEKTIDLQNRVTLPEINGVTEAYIGIIDGKELLDLMTDDKGELMTNVFYDNVRDYQGENKVNIEIANTLRSSKRDTFVILNNGITIVSEELKPVRNKFTLSNYQIINGCQTSHVLFENKEFVDSEVKIPIKLIVSTNEDLTSDMIRSTNRQTAIKEEDLIAFTNFQKRLEDYYNSFTGDEKLYYERRSKQFNSKSVEKKKIIDKTTQIKAIASMFYEKPEMATRYFGALFLEFGEKLFKDNHQMYPYYVAAYGIYKLDSLFRTKDIDTKYKKIKYHILTMLRLEIQQGKCPPFESKKSIVYCDKIYEVFRNEDRLIRYIKKVVNKIDSLGYDLSNSELSKSKEFVKKCIELYGAK